MNTRPVGLRSVLCVALVRAVGGLLMAVICIFGVLPPASAAGEAVPAPSVGYTYDAPRLSTEHNNAVTERGPPMVAYDYTTPLWAVDAASHGPLVRPHVALTGPYTTYDLLAQLAHGGSGTGMTRTASDDSAAEGRAISGATSAAKSEGPLSRMLGNRVRDERGSFGFPGGASRLTNSQITDMATRLGFRPTNFTSQRQIVFTDGKNFITQDITSHTGGLWKMARTPEGLGSKTTRMGTYDYDLNYIAP